MNTKEAMFNYRSDIDRIQIDAQKYYFLYNLGEVLSSYNREHIDPEQVAHGLLPFLVKPLPEGYYPYGMDAIYLYLVAAKEFDVEEAELLSVSTIWKLLHEEVALQIQADESWDYSRKLRLQRAQGDENSGDSKTPEMKTDLTGLGQNWEDEQNMARLFSARGRENTSPAATQALRWARRELQLDKLGYFLALEHELAHPKHENQRTGMDALRTLVSNERPAWPAHTVAQLGHRGIEMVLAQKLLVASSLYPLSDEELNAELFQSAV